jgi:hypothetical protein
MGPHSGLLGVSFYRLMLSAYDFLGPLRSSSSHHEHRKFVQLTLDFSGVIVTGGWRENPMHIIGLFFMILHFLVWLCCY